MTDTASPPMQFLMSLWDAWQGLTRAGEGQLRGHHGLSLREFIVLSYIGGGTQQPSALAQALNVPRYDISRTLTRLEAAGLLLRQTDAQDARRSELHLSAAGRQLQAQAESTVLEFISRPLAGLAAQPDLPDTLTLSRALRALHPAGPLSPSDTSPHHTEPTQGHHQEPHHKELSR
ncbi:MarR family winged helix-turn-helix transcriptional regulator [Deinococcus sp. Marseille-Q6407]|uniref:MarR family winged helix-turn-helix transcriptional regulator n=1 Tax=Deinococcus sp. Marseille-Q6407 TaxID=2969223 RepID=UPI0021C237FD|nr:MarR family winged helix-turn-helix transcriptional regulator [Deinococcus sp. Marseille-Q6407]